MMDLNVWALSEQERNLLKGRSDVNGGKPRFD
jgi:hypothetical protein